MTSENKDQIESKVADQEVNLTKLSNALFDKSIAVANKLEGKEGAPLPPRVVAFVGAGASKAAKLPLSYELKKKLYQKFSCEPIARKIIKEEYKFYKKSEFEGFNLNRISPFELAAIISRFAYGNKIIKKTIDEEYSNPTHRPLSYELLAHLAKHGYVDHFIILNYDHLLSDALEDELPKSQLKIIRSREDIPFQQNDNKRISYAVYPFGMLGAGALYSLTTEDVAEFGCEPIRKFIKNEILNSQGSKESILLLMIGYRGSEPAFKKLLRSIRNEMDISREINLFVINPHESQVELNELIADSVIKSVTNISLHADIAFELLFDLLKQKWTEEKRHGWIPVARHRILSKLFNLPKMKSEDRFKIELLLQGIKSRGFVHFESYSRIHRLMKYGNDKSADVIQYLIKKRLLKADKWLPELNGCDEKLTKHYVPNYIISGSNDNTEKSNCYALVIQELLNKKNKHLINNTVIKEWIFDDEGYPRLNKTTRQEFLQKEFNKIQSSSDIEIVPDIAPEEHWVLESDPKSKKAKPLLSIGALKNKTKEILEGILTTASDEIPATICGIWSTGEWLFWDGAWGEDLGNRILENPFVTLKMLITKSGGRSIVRTSRRLDVINKLKKHEKSKQGSKIELKWLNWWEMNRILTLVSCKGNESAIHMRRRLNTPLVCPYFIPSKAEVALKYLKELWDLYWCRGEDIPDSDQPQS
jgi:hypothetical protein